MDIFEHVSRKDPNRIAYESPLDTISELYHEASKFNAGIFQGVGRHIREIVEKEFFLNLFSRSYKTYPTSPSIELPYNFRDTPSSKILREVVLKRRSIRKYSGEPILLNHLANILFNAYGITAKTDLTPEIKQKLRTIPSGGALYPLELYVAAHQVEGLPPGIYHYNVEGHALELVREGQFSAQLGCAVFYEEMFEKVSATFIITGQVRRSFIKYGERSYRFMLMEAGHLGQNICLTSFALDLGCVMLGGFYDDDLDEIVGADGVNETALYAAAVGTIADDRT